MNRLLEVAKKHLPNGTYTANSTMYDPEEIAKRKATRYNSEHGELEDYDCQECLNRGCFMETDGSGGTYFRECKCMAIRRGRRRMQKSGLSSLLDDYTMENFKTPERWQRAAKEKASAYLSNSGNGWFVASGCVGSGKSHLCTAICKELMLSGEDVRYMLWRDMGARLKASVNDSERYKAMIDPLKNTTVLYIDDFWKGANVTDGDINLAFEILNHRYVSKRRTIISTEKTIEQILDIDEAIGSRIYQRGKGYYLAFPEGKNWRMR